MSLSQDYNNLFRRSDISDQLSLMQSLLDSKDLTPAEAIALFHIIRVELESPQPHRSSIYRRYIQLMQSLHREMPEVHEQVVQAWEAKKAKLQTNKKPMEDLAGSLLKLGDESSMDHPSASIAGYSQTPEKAAHSIQEKVNAPESNDESAEGLEVAEGEHEKLQESKEEVRPELEEEEQDEQFDEEGEEHPSPEAEAKVELNKEDQVVEQAEDRGESLEEPEEQIELPAENADTEAEEAGAEPNEGTGHERQESSEDRQAGREDEDRAPTEAGEAAEHMEVEPDVAAPGEEEPPIEAEE